MNKILLGLGTIAAVSAPICAVSCMGQDDVKTIKTNIPGNLTWKTKGDISVAIIDKTMHMLLVKSYWEEDVFNGAAGGLGLTSIIGTKEIYHTFGLDEQWGDK